MVDGFKDVELFLKENGRFLSTNQQDDLYFTDTTKYETFKDTFVLRIRRAGKKAFLTFKGSTGKQGVYEEYETEVLDLDALDTMLQKSGFEKFLEIRKHRVIYEFEGAEINLDEVEGLGKFVEIEVIAEENADAKLIEMTEKLGLSGNESTRLGYVTLLLKKTGSKYSKFMQY